MADEVKDRLQQFIEFRNITVAEFEKTAQLGNGIISKPSKLSKASINKICVAFPALNREWLETGEGEMMKQTAPEGISIVHSPNSAATLRGNAIVHSLEEHDELIRLREENRQLYERIAELKRMNEYLMKTS